VAGASVPEYVRVGVVRGRGDRPDDLVEILEAAEDVIVVGEALGAETLGAVHATEEPDVVVLDLDAPGAEIPETTRRVAQDHPSARLLILSDSADEADLDRAIGAGVRGYVVKPTRRRDLVDAVRLVASGHMVIDARFAGRRPSPEPGTREPRERRALTDRELEVLVLASSGRTVPEIADRLGVSTTTVKRGVARICAKLGAPDLDAAIARAARTGIVSLRHAGPVWILEVPRPEDEGRR